MVTVYGAMKKSQERELQGKHSDEAGKGGTTKLQQWCGARRGQTIPPGGGGQLTNPAPRDKDGG